MHSSFPHLLPALARDFSSGSSFFLATLRSTAPPSLPYPSPAVPPLSTHLSASSVPLVPPRSAPAASQAMPVPFSSLLAPPPGFFLPAPPLTSFLPTHSTSYSGSLSAPAPPTFPIQGLVVVHGLGVGVPSSSGAPVITTWAHCPRRHGFRGFLPCPVRSSLLLSVGVVWSFRIHVRTGLYSS